MWFRKFDRGSPSGLIELDPLRLITARTEFDAFRRYIRASRGAGRPPRVQRKGERERDLFAFNLAIRVAGGQQLKRWKPEMREGSRGAGTYTGQVYALVCGEREQRLGRERDGGETRLGKPTEKGDTSDQTGR